MTQACAGQVVQVVADRLDRGRDDRLVERGQEHAHHQPGQDRQDLAVRQRTVRRWICRAGGGGGHAVGLLPSRPCGRRAGSRRVIQAVVDVVVGGGEPRPAAGRTGACSAAAPAGQHLVEERVPGLLVLGDGGSAGVGDAPAGWPGRRAGRPGARAARWPTSAATCRLTVDRSDCTLAASALARIGPSARHGVQQQPGWPTRRRCWPRPAAGPWTGAPCAAGRPPRRRRCFRRGRASLPVAAGRQSLLPGQASWSPPLRHILVHANHLHRSSIPWSRRWRAESPDTLRATCCAPNASVGAHYGSGRRPSIRRFSRRPAMASRSGGGRR